MLGLIQHLENIKIKCKIVLIYLHEAHADDIWPLGYGVTSAKNLDEKWQNCDALMNKFPQLNDLVD